MHMAGETGGGRRWEPTVNKPRGRSPLRRVVGREWHILKRRARWLRSGADWAADRAESGLDHVLHRHRTPLIRPLPDVQLVYQHNKIANLHIAVPRIDGVVLAPGQTLSFWRLIGRPTRRRGFREGFALREGQVVGSIGGGLCQLSNLMFWIALHSPLTVVERWRHSFDVFPDAGRTQPFGSGATCAYNNIDLQLRNDTPDRFQFRLSLDDTHLHGALHSDAAPLYGYEVVETDHLIRQQKWGGYTRHNRIARDVVSNVDGAVLRREPVVENHAVMMYSPLLHAPG